MPEPKWTRIVSADDDTVGGDILEWSGLGEVWYRYDLSRFYDFLQDAVEFCDSVRIEREEWDANMPGRSGVWHEICTNDETRLKRELRTLLAELLWKARGKIRQANLAREMAEKEIAAGPAQYQHLLSIADAETDSMGYPETVEYHIELCGGPNNCFRLWKRVYSRWDRATDMRDQYSTLDEAARHYTWTIFEKFYRFTKPKDISPGSILGIKEILAIRRRVVKWRRESCGG